MNLNTLKAAVKREAPIMFWWAYPGFGYKRTGRWGTVKAFERTKDGDYITILSEGETLTVHERIVSHICY